MTNEYGTCGHILTRGFESLALKCVDHDLDADCLVNKVSYGTYCHPCARRLRKIGMVLENKAEEHDWLTGPLC